MKTIVNITRWIIIALFLAMVQNMNAMATNSSSISVESKEMISSDNEIHFYSTPICVEVPDFIELLPQTAEHKVKLDIYDFPYSISRNMPDWNRLWINTGVLFAGGIAAIGILEALPDNSTNWSTAERREIPLFKRWWKHVKNGPHWDGDSWAFNFILHPYGGAAYFMGARSCGFNFWYSFLYSACVSTFFWEYGIEAFNEIPSLQDLFITPVFGSLIGEGFYNAKRYIVDHDYYLLGWKPLGYVVAFILDPLNELVGYFRSDSPRNKKYRFQKVPVEAADSSPYLITKTDGCNISTYFGPASGSAFSISMSMTF